MSKQQHVQKIIVAIRPHTCDRAYSTPINKLDLSKKKEFSFLYSTLLYSSRPSRPREVRGKASSAAAQRKKSLGGVGNGSKESSVTVSGGNNGGCGGNASRRKSNGNGANGHSGKKRDRV